MNARTSAPSGAFSLLEVMIALAVVAIAVLALARVSGDAPAHLAHMRERSIAQWVAENAVAGMRLESDLPDTGERAGRERMGGIDWRWRAAVDATAQPRLRRVEVRVYRAGSAEPVTRHTAYLGS